MTAYKTYKGMFETEHVRCFSNLGLDICGSRPPSILFPFLPASRVWSVTPLGLLVTVIRWGLSTGHSPESHGWFKDGKASQSESAIGGKLVPGIARGKLTLSLGFGALLRPWMAWG